jgi:hypothetical protein
MILDYRCRGTMHISSLTVMFDQINYLAIKISYDLKIGGLCTLSKSF